jgi:hypothetical protein
MNTKPRVGAFVGIAFALIFIMGVKGTMEGKYVLGRAIPAGAFLLFFIGIFGWSIYRTFKAKV